VLKEEFRRWAEHGCRLYGNDPWFFLRELAQNSRDADARSIDVTALRDEAGREVIAFEDDGTGMSFEHARRYLFRLYASSKEDDERSAGKYGIGFWSVLRFRPSRILIESRTRSRRWAILVDEDFTLARADCRLERRGTRITLEREPRFKNERALRHTVRDALNRYCRYLRRNDRGFTKLPVAFNGRNLTRSMRLPGPVSLSFKEGSVEGAVGLAESPRVKLHARGLPVWNGVLLDELSHTADREPANSEIADGLAPVFLLNGNDLNVVMSRRAVIDDSALAKVRRKARTALGRLVRLHMEHTFPRSWPRRIIDGLQRTWNMGRVKPAYVVLTVLLAVLATLVATRIPGLRLAEQSAPVSFLPGTYSGPVVEGPPSGVIVDLTYEPAGQAWFKIMTADRYDPARGFMVRDRKASPVLAYTCTEDCITVRIRLDLGGRTTVPMPGGYRLDPDSLLFDGLPVEGTYMTEGGDTVVPLPDRGGVLTYATGPAPPAGDLAVPERADLTSVPAGMDLPEKIGEVVLQAAGKDMETRVLTSLVTSRVMVDYDDSAETARAYRGLDESDGWLDFVIETGKGDCDVINSVNALLLRRMDVPARLAIGLVGSQGRALPQLHAWTEYHHGTWRVIDATPLIAPSSVSSSPAPPESEVEPEKSLGPVPPTLAFAGRAATEAPQEASSAQEEPERESRLIAILGRIPAGPLGAALVLLALGVLVSVLVAVRRPGWEHMEEAADARHAEQILASIISSASAHPRLWRHARELWHHRLLPTLGGARISVMDARRLAGRRKLFLGRGMGRLARRAARAGSVVLDRDDRAFGPLLGRLPGVIDLDAIEDLEAKQPRSDDVLDKLLRRVNRLLAVSGGDDVRLLRAPGLTHEDLHDVDLRTLSYSKGSRWPRRFIAVNPTGRHVRRCCDLSAKNPELAAYELVEKAARDSLLLSDRAERIRSMAARILVLEAS